MARKAVERNIAYDDQRKLYYVSTVSYTHLTLPTIRLV